MIKSPIFNFQQDNLELMSSDKELITDETLDVNDFYGQAKIIREYAKYSRPIKVVYEHSLPIHDLIWDVDKNCSLDIAFVSSSHRLNVYKKQKAKKLVFNIGSVLNYAICISDPIFAKNNFKSVNERQGSIYFPNHSTHHIKSSVDSTKIIDSLLKLPKIYHPVYVCMYWKDILNGEHKNYINRGINVVCAGHIYDNMFYFRLYDILKNFKYTLGSSFGSFVFHAARSGCLVIFPKELKNLKETFSISTENFKDKDFENRVRIAEEFDKVVSKIFSEHIEKYTDEQIKFIENYSSSKTESPLKLKTILLFAELLYFLQHSKKYFIQSIKKILPPVFISLYRKLKN